ncbi:MAG TPA: hypothetical protein V6D14_14860 [Coleofasciculaceae cyanobacterium]|jgi:hypothetical protein
MSEIPEIPLEEIKDSAVKFDLANLRLEIGGMLKNLERNSDALDQLHELLLDAVEKCSQAIAELESSTPRSKDRRIPDD